MPNDLLRTTTFILPPEAFGGVYAYRAGDVFWNAWDATRKAWQRQRRKSEGEPRRLPYASLATALQVLSGDFVRVRPWANSPKSAANDPYFLVARQQLDESLLQLALLGWEAAILDAGEGRLADAVGDLKEERLQVWEHVQRRPGRCPRAEGWVWEAARWSIAHRLAQHPLQVERAVPMRLDTAADLMSWDALVEGGKRPEHAAHRVKLHLITVPGIETPALNVTASCTRFAAYWSGDVRTAWYDYAPDVPLLRAAVRFRGKARWAERAPEVLSKASLMPLPNLSDARLTTDGCLRAIFWHPKPRFPIGRGVGQMFQDGLAGWVRETMPEAEPVLLERTTSRVPQPSAGEEGLNKQRAAAMIEDSGTSLARLLVLYHNPHSRARMLRGLAEVLGDPGEQLARLDDGKVLHPYPGLEVLIQSPQGSERLVRWGAKREVQDWITEAVQGEFAKNGRTAVLAETLSTETLSERPKGVVDPKFEVRNTLARCGVPCQFLAYDPEAEVEEAGFAERRAAWDLLRNAGLLPDPFPDETLSNGQPTWLVGVYIVKPTAGHWWKQAGRGKNSKHVVAIVAGRADSRETLGYDATRGWLPLGEATPAFHRCANLLSQAEVRRMVDTAIQELAQDRPGSIVLYMNAQGCRTLWNGLADTGDGELPRAAQDYNAAVVRVRTQPREDVPQIAGVGAWPDEPFSPFSSKTGLFRVKGASEAGSHLFVITPTVMGRLGPHRSKTRFGMTATQQKKDLHALSIREFNVVRSGPFNREDLGKLSAALCRFGVTWDGVLRRPAPLHLASVLVADHPARFVASDDEDK